MYELGQKEERAPYGRVEESLGGDPHTLPESVRSFSALKKPKLLTQQTSPMLIESRPENCGDVIEVDQTAPLTRFMHGWCEA
jgi:hypothetical protein